MVNKRPPVSLIYSVTGGGKTTLFLTAGEAGYTPLFVTTELKQIHEDVIKRFIGYGGIFALAEKPTDWMSAITEMKKHPELDMLILDGMTASIMNHLSTELAKASDGRAVYGNNLTTVVNFLFGVNALGVPVLMSALEKVDRLYEGGPSIQSEASGGNEKKIEAKVEKEQYMPAFPGQLEHLVGGIGCDIIGRLVVQSGNVRQLLIESSKTYMSRVPTGYHMKNIRQPTIHKLLEGWGGAPTPRVSYEDTVRLIEGK